MKKFTFILIIIVLISTNSLAVNAGEKTKKDKEDYSNYNLVVTEEYKKQFEAKALIEDISEEFIVSNPEIELYFVPTFDASWPYYYTATTSYNCYGYASQFKQFINPGYYYGGDNLYGISTYGAGYFNSSTLAYLVKKDLNDQGRSCRTVSGPDAALETDEFLIVVRAGIEDFNNDGQISIGGSKSEADYHFMVKNSDGGWSHKPGGTPTVYLGNINPSTYNWKFVYDGQTVNYFYDSPAVYLAISE